VKGVMELEGNLLLFGRWKKKKAGETRRPRVAEVVRRNMAVRRCEKETSSGKGGGGSEERIFCDLKNTEAKGG